MANRGVQATLPHRGIARQHLFFERRRSPCARQAFSNQLSGIGEIASIQGPGRVQAGQTYGFYCSIDPGMRGQLTVR
jgi:hypothetical protein